MNYSEEFILSFTSFINSKQTTTLLNMKPERLGHIIMDMVKYSLVTDLEIESLKGSDPNSLEFREIERKMNAQLQGMKLYRMWESEYQRICETTTNRSK